MIEEQSFWIDLNFDFCENKIAIKPKASVLFLCYAFTVSKISALTMHDLERIVDILGDLYTYGKMVRVAILKF